MAKAVMLPKRFTIILFSIGLAAALVAVDYVSELVVSLMDGLSGQAGSIDGTASIGAIIAAVAVIAIMAKSQRAVIALLAGFVAGCLIRFLLMLPGA